MFVFGHLGVTLGVVFLALRLLKLRTKLEIKFNRRLYLFVFTGSLLPDLIDKPVGEILLAGSISNGRIFAHTLLFNFLLLLFCLWLYKRSGSREGKEGREGSREGREGREGSREGSRGGRGLGGNKNGFWFLLFSFASFLHLCEDRMWLTPETLFFPVFGFEFPQGAVESHWWDFFLGCFFGTYSPLRGAELSYVFVSEMVGFSVLLAFGLHHFHSFILRYRMSNQRWSSR
ncbi:MAG TPA: hypothetical protein ENG23_04400 [Methanomicrobia archaeon]|nr:hypothetical protein [Methanomicrobia archaeon]